MSRKKLINDIKKHINKTDKTLGLRVPDNCRYWFEENGIEYKEKEYQVGDKLEASFDWSDEEPSEQKLDGTSVIKVKSIDKIEKALELIRLYVGKTLLLVEGYEHAKGQDAGEAILEDCKILEVYDYDILRN